MRQSLVTVERDGDGGDVRYRLLETFRAYAAARLEEAGERAEVSRRHLRYYQGLVRASGVGSRGAAELAGMAILDREGDNVHAALQLAIEAGSEPALALASDLWPYWARRGRFGEGLRFLDAALPLSPADSPTRSEALIGRATMALRLNLLDDAEAGIAEAIALCRRLGDRRREARALDVLGKSALRRGDHARALGVNWEALALRRAAGDDEGAAISLVFLAQVANTAGRHEEADQLLLEAWSLVQGREMLETECMVLADLGDSSARHGRVVQAIGYSERALVLARRLGQPDRIASIQVNLAELQVRQGDAVWAVERLEEAVALFRDFGYRAHLADALWVLGTALAAANRPDAALLALREALALYHDQGHQLSVAQTIEAIATVEIATGQVERAARWFGAAEAMRDRLGAEPYVRSDYEDAVRRLRSRLGPRLDPLWDAGRGLPPNQAVLEALYDSAPATQPSQPWRQDPGALTERQRAVLRLVAAGRSNREIAQTLAISVRTVERHLTAIYTVLGVERRGGAILAALARGLVG